MTRTLVYLVGAAGTAFGAFICHFISNLCGLQQGMLGVNTGSYH